MLISQNNSKPSAGARAVEGSAFETIKVEPIEELKDNINDLKDSSKK